MHGSSTTNVAAKDRIREALGRLDNLLVHSAAQASNAGYFLSLGSVLRELHPRVRQHHAACCLSSADDGTPIAPQYRDDLTRLSDEHSTILGVLDRLVRSLDDLADRPVEDREVFFLRVREMIATLRRHEAEEDRLFYLSVWRETGGES